MLDVGSGTGRLASLLVERYGCKVWGVDPEPEMVEVARAKVPSGVGLKIGCAEDLPFKDGWFERVTMTLVLQLVDRPRAFAEAIRVLQPGGRLALATFDYATFRALLPRRLLPVVRGPGQGALPVGGPARGGAPGRRFPRGFAHSPALSVKRSAATRCSSASASSTSPPSSSSPGTSTAPGSNVRSVSCRKSSRTSWNGSSRPPSGKRHLVPAQLCLDRRFVLPLVAPARMYTSTRAVPSSPDGAARPDVRSAVERLFELGPLDGPRRGCAWPLRP